MSAALFDLSGKLALVTGAGSGLGLEFSRGFAASDAEVICW
jgi:NAD(P)-dependent dehydrogenase (short-subunit alcohol dehydrogenase family)